MGAAFAGLQCSRRESSASATRVVDLGHPIADTDPSWSGERVFTYKPLTAIAKDGYFSGEFTSEEHFGTHVDAPAHFAANGLTIDQIPAERLVRPGRCVNVAAAVAGNDDYLVRVDDLKAYEQAHGGIHDGDVVFIATG